MADILEFSVGKRRIPSLSWKRIWIFCPINAVTYLIAKNLSYNHLIIHTTAYQIAAYW